MEMDAGATDFFAITGDSLLLSGVTNSNDLQM
jgi:hypothetical protein